MLCTQEVSIKVDRRRPYTITSTSVAESLEISLSVRDPIEINGKHPLPVWHAEVG